MAEASEIIETDKAPKKVQEIAKGFLEIGDEMLAYRLQNEEYREKYNWNRGERKTARQDVPLAHQVHTEEEIRLQRETFERLERLKKLAEEDARIAREIQENESQTLTRRNKHRHRDMEEQIGAIDFTGAPSNLPTLRQAPATPRQPSTADDEDVAMLVHEKEVLERQKQKIEQEIKDERLAIELYNDDLRKLTTCGGQPESTGHHSKRKDSLNRVNEGKLGGKVISMKEFEGFQVSDEISEEERREIIRMQDEELARALQESEQLKVARRRAEKEKKDEDLARLIQHTERLNLEKDHHHHHHHRHHHSSRLSNHSANESTEGDYLVPQPSRPINARNSSGSSNPYSPDLENALNERAWPRNGGSSSSQSSVVSMPLPGIPGNDGAVFSPTNHSGGFYENISSCTENGTRDGRKVQNFPTKSLRK